MQSLGAILLVIMLAFPMTACQPAADTLTLDRIVELSQKGEDLTWSDFKDYPGIETGSGLYIMVYDVEPGYQVWIGGGSTEQKPMYIRLVDKENLDRYIDLRTGDVSAFLSENDSAASQRQAGGIS